MREPLNLVILLIAIVVAIPLFGWLLTLVQIIFRTVLSIAAIGVIAALILIVRFGVSSDQIVHPVSHVSQTVRQYVIDGNAP
jgi:hypothetical protein